MTILSEISEGRVTCVCWLCGDCPQGSGPLKPRSDPPLPVPRPTSRLPCWEGALPTPKSVAASPGLLVPPAVSPPRLREPAGPPPGVSSGEWSSSPCLCHDSSQSKARRQDSPAGTLLSQLQDQSLPPGDFSHRLRHHAAGADRLGPLPGHDVLLQRMVPPDNMSKDPCKGKLSFEDVNVVILSILRRFIGGLQLRLAMDLIYPNLRCH
ncbi:uncharacterized protein LOC126076216 isoform X2 [Elephas maximus indicus]|uniref:uncharacterized protein LOC126076216 isoform X2 n=1 Tax=Elephas maximus indicus TaxID=99487 RepID=UPI0021170ADE|nr:uncharacterized protein LOC126076216 isoform X2 [Elephas maximus indicus]